MPIGTLCLGHSSGNCAQAATLCCRGSKQHHRTSRSLKPAGRHSSSAIPAFGCEVGSVARDTTRLGGEHQCAQGDEPVGDRKSVVEGKSVSVRVDLGGRRFIKKKIYTT